jgi:endonuclease YncB( thermonuclease family)
MITSTYDPCLLITTTKGRFGIVEMQIDDTIILANEPFLTLEKNELLNAKFIAKPKEKLTPNSPLIFNGCVLIQDGNTMSLRQKKQDKKIKLIDIDAPDTRQKYVEQRARKTYIASIY